MVSRNYRPRTQAELEEAWRNPAERDEIIAAREEALRRTKVIMAEHPNLSVDAAALLARMDAEADVIREASHFEHDPSNTQMYGEMSQAHHAQVMALLAHKGITEPTARGFTEAYRQASAELDNRERAMIHEDTVFAEERLHNAAEQVGTMAFSEGDQQAIRDAVARFGDKGRRRASEFQRRYREANRRRNMR